MKVIAALGATLIALGMQPLKNPDTPSRVSIFEVQSKTPWYFLLTTSTSPDMVNSTTCDLCCNLDLTS